MCLPKTLPVPENVLHVCRHLNQSGYEAWLVGGAVRDALRLQKGHDWDITTNALPTDVVALFGHVVPTGIRHGTVTVMLDGEGYEVTTFRGEGSYSDGRRPDEVTFLQTIEEDLSRRDFTINAIAYDPLTQEVRDPFGGREDILRSLIRAVGDPLRRFSEDGLRTLRAARFAATLGYDLEEKTLEAIRQSLDTLAMVSEERVHDELLKAMSAPKPSRAFQVMADTGMLWAILPELVPMLGCKQNRFHGFDVWLHTLETVDACPADDIILRMAALLHDVGKPTVKGVNEATGDSTFYDHEVIGAEMADVILTRLKFSNEHKSRIVHLVRYHYVRYERSWSSATLRRWVRKVGLSHVPALIQLGRADRSAKGPSQVELDASLFDELEERLATLQVSEVIPTSTHSLAINGDDVMEVLGLSPGPQVGKVLNQFLEVVTEDPSLNTREKLLLLLQADADPP
jgi:tRNA nucleotidyltransferase (CCA-adding enzyme)